MIEDDSCEISSLIRSQNKATFFLKICVLKSLDGSLKVSPFPLQGGIRWVIVLCYDTKLLFCQPRVIVTSCFVYKVIRNSLLYR